MFDTLNRRSLQCYGGDTVRTPNFDRLARHSVVFDTHYVGSLPCMPARREMMTGRHNFLHRSWGPLEPFDHALPELLYEACSTYSHLSTDHLHYWDDGGATYHTRFDSFDLIRGNQGDAWKGVVEPDEAAWKRRYHPVQMGTRRRRPGRRDMINRDYVLAPGDYPAARTFDAGLEFIARNREADNWFLQIETFDPHEPFDAPAAWRADYPTHYRGPTLDWPAYGAVHETPDEIAELRANYAATLAHCDHQLGRVLDALDRHGLWRDTAVVMTTDHGFLLGEQDSWGKCIMPVYNEVAHIPLMIWHPAFSEFAGQRRSALTQTIDLVPTFLDIFGMPVPAEVQGRSLLPLLSDPAARVREHALYGQHGCAVNVTDGRYTLFHYPPDIRGGDLYNYTLMPTHLQRRFSVDELREATLAPPFDFTQGVPVLKVPCDEKSPVYNTIGAGRQIDVRSRLYDLATDPGQLQPIEAPEVRDRLMRAMVALMRANDAPREAYRRFGVEALLDEVPQ
jgi:arylsulfatase A-like enzyme